MAEVTAADLLARVPLLGSRVVDLVRRIKYPEVERDVDADYLRSVRDLEWLRRAMPSIAADAPRLLIVSLSDMVYQLKLEGMLAAAIRQRGWRPIVLTNSRSNTRAIRYFHAFGIDDFVFLSEFPPTREEKDRAHEAAVRLLQGDISFRTVKSWRFEQCWVGPQILSTVSRSRHEGAPDPREPHTRAEIEKLLPEILERTLVSHRLISRVQPKLGLVIEANYVLNSPFVDAMIAAETSVIQIVQPWRDDSLTFKRLTRSTRRMHPSSVSPETFERLLNERWTEAEEQALNQVFRDRYNGTWFLQARNQPATIRVNRAELCERLGLDPKKKTATVFSHVLWDANLFYGDDLFEDYGEWFVETVRAAAANPRLNWIIKLHPANLWKRAREGAVGEFSELILIRNRIGNLPSHIHILKPDTDISTASLFEFTDFGVTVRGTAGMELPCFGKPLLTAGTGRYSGLGFTVDSLSSGEYLSYLAQLHERAPMTAAQTQKARRHAYAAFVRRQWQMKSFRSIFDHERHGRHPLDYNLKCLVADAAGARRNGDLDRWAEWAKSDQVDYLEA